MLYLGVIWTQYKPIPGAPECIDSIKRLGKRVHYVSNNSTIQIENLKQILDSIGIKTDVEDIIIPIIAIIDYLKKDKI
ncbi:hypothetical protein NQ317_018898 [Molorchus minor]|uniref:Uncharacterized protein n=1 Tax=Molorchus minor TaxID=1323400 RepID=A0ABQ9IQF1_9CUCU|nr:hypothetical protein NQ317_018898 [Molorchus minor]